MGKAKVELETYGIRKFKVTFSGVHQYVVAKTRFEDEIYPMIKNKMPNRNFDKKFVMVALLQVSSLEYEFFNEKGGKVEVKPGSEIEKVLRGKIGVEWSANQRDNLSINSPKFIGYRMARLTASGYQVLAAGSRKIELRDIALDDLRNAAQ